MNKDFVDLALSRCEQALIRHGFRRLRKHDVAFDISPDWLGWLGLNTGNYSTHLLINPFVGIHCIPLMKLVDQLDGKKYRLGAIATYAIHMGELCPNEDAVIFTPDSDFESVSEKLALLTLKYGVPYMKDLATFEATLKALLTRVETFGGYPQRVAAALHLMGKHEEAISFVKQCQTKYLKEGQNIQDIFNRFAIPFLKMVTH